MHVKPKKRLGQNFLVDKNIQRKIVESCEFKPTDAVLEIGAGRGELTRLIANRAGSIYALEIDPYLCGVLKDSLKGCGNVRIINKDILKFNLNAHFKKTETVKILGNIPYYIVTPIIEHLLKYRHKIEVIFITVQKEFARRITAAGGSKDYSSFSCFVQYYTEPKILFHIKNSCFLPPPKVDSSFLRLKIRKILPVKPKDERLLFKIIRSAFNQRRKTLRNSLRGIIPRQNLEIFFNKYNIDPNIRPENLALNDFANLANI